MTDEKNQPLKPKSDTVREPDGTTHDVREEAGEALRRFELQKDQERPKRDAPLLESPVVLRLVVSESGFEINLTLEDSVIVGRRDPSGNEIPDIDLSEHGAYQMGVSRRHATLRLKDQGLELVDLGSRNGTFINEYKLVPHKPEQIIDKDEIRFGKCKLVVYVNPA